MAFKVSLLLIQCLVTKVLSWQNKLSCLNIVSHVYIAVAMVNCEVVKLMRCFWFSFSELCCCCGHSSAAAKFTG